MSVNHEINLKKEQQGGRGKYEQRPVVLKHTKLIPNENGEIITVDKTTVKIGAKNYKDTGVGFLLEEPEKKELRIIEEKAPILESERPTCIECDQTFAISFLYDNFNYCVCNDCRTEEKHDLIPRTGALESYCLKPVDLDKREPFLKYIIRKNPHNPRWGDMKLYLHRQVAQRAVEVWGSEEAVHEELRNRSMAKAKRKVKRYEKQLKKLRMEMRSSLYDKTLNKHHIHAYEPETYDEENDTYTRICTTCGFGQNFEKM